MKPQATQKRRARGHHDGPTKKCAVATGLWHDGCPHGMPLPTKPLKRSPLRSSPTRLPQRNAKRKGHRFPKNVDEKFRAWVRKRGCMLEGHPLHQCSGMPGRHAVEFLHLKTRGSGGPDRGNGVPGCPLLHEETEGRGNRQRAEKKYGVDFMHTAKRLNQLYEADTATWDSLGRGIVEMEPNFEV